ncbi:Na+/H+ antiporter subunit E [Ornithinimicrobium avium]|uniref:Na+/H+ antiporter subunit E n=1 Tax=Ornithinimicrobium avium TaxID=2283195 RepID=A0A345NNY3_9MICO|nr:Na+/H+ antiporter subunit E [Ornithinimicrobium avium]AXH96741.1 Na+/H+ antiporter subunit E [Ornithinimicrobium avium]
MRGRLLGRQLSWWSILWLTVVWVVLWRSPSVLTVVGGVAVAVLVLVAFPLPRVRVRLRLHPWPFVVLLVRFLWDLTVASVHVAWLAIAHGPTTRGVVMDIQLVAREELLQTITAELVALVPGTVVIDLDSRDRLLTLHALEVENDKDAQRVRRNVRAQEARVVRALHPDPEAVLDPRRSRAAAAVAQGPAAEGLGAAPPTAQTGRRRDDGQEQG